LPNDDINQDEWQAFIIIITTSEIY
jgi:hypothetical protein